MILQNISCKRLSEGKNCMQHKRTPLQELNGRPLNRDDNENGFKTNSKKQIARAAHFFF